MRGFPKHIGTIEDLKNLKEEFPVEVKEFVAGMLEHTQEWFPVGEVESIEAGKTDDTHKVTEEKGMMGEDEVKFYQYELKKNPAAALYSFFKNKEEAQEFIK